MMIMQSFRVSEQTAVKIKKEADAHSIPIATYLRAIVETKLDEPKDERMCLLLRHDMMLKSVKTLTDQILKTEAYIRSYDLESTKGFEDWGIMVNEIMENRKEKNR